MKHFLFLAGLLGLLSAGAQSSLQPMIAAENAFAATSVQQNTRDAFLAYMDTSAIMFQKNAFTKAYPEWQAREKRPGLLDWKPVVAEIAASGDWGFTTGPWTFRAGATDTVSARGHFFTIWHRQPDGQWKFLFDCGSDGGTEPLAVLYPFQAEKRRGDESTLLLVDSAYNALLGTNSHAAHQSFLSVTSLLCRNGQPYALTPGQQAKWIKALPATIEGRVAGRLVAPSGDLALVYGTTSKGGSGTEPFVRLWRYEPGGWRLAVELLRL